MLLSIVLAILLCLGGYWWYHYARIPNKFPNGPYGLPFIGYIGILKAPNLIEAFKGLIFIFASFFSFPEITFGIGIPCVGCPRLRIEKQINLFYTLQLLHETYGKCFSVNLGPNQRCVVVSDTKILKELFQNSDALTARYYVQPFRGDHIFPKAHDDSKQKESFPG